MSDSEGSSSDFELVSHDSLAASAAHPSTGGGTQGSGRGTPAPPANLDRSGFVGTLRLAGQDGPRPAATSITTRRSLYTPHLTHSQHAQSPPVTDSEYDALSESSMDEVDHGYGDDSAELERATRLFTPGQPSATVQQDLVPAATSLHHLSSSSASESSMSLDMHASDSSLSHSTVSTTTSDETDDDEVERAGEQLDHQAQGHQVPLAAVAATGAAVNFMDHGDPFPSTFPMSVAHLPTFTLTLAANNGGTGAGHHDQQQQEQFTLPGAETDTDTDDDCPLIDHITKTTNATGHHGFNHDLVMRSRLVHHGVAASTPASASDSLGRDDFEELTRLLSSDAQGNQDADPEAQLDSVIDMTPNQSHLGTLANVSGADLPDMVPAIRVSDAPAPAAAAGETHVRDAATGAADPNGLMQILSEHEAAAGPPAEPDAPPPAPRATLRKSPTPPRAPTASVHFDVSPPSSPAKPTDPVFASDTSLHLVSGGSPCPCPSCDLRPGGPGWSLFRTLGPRKYPTASMRKYADAHATQRMHARVRHASVVSGRLAHGVTLAVGVLIGWLVSTWWMQAGMLAAYQKEVRGLHAQLALGAAQVQGTRVAVNQVHARVAAQGTWIKAEVYEARMQVKQLASVLQAYQRAVVEGGGRGRGVVERFGELMKRADEFLGRVGGMHGYPEGELGNNKLDVQDEAEDKVQDEAIVVEDVIVTEPDEVPATAEEVPKPSEKSDATHHQAPPNAVDMADTDAPRPETKHDSADTPADDHAQGQDEEDDNPHAVTESPMSMIARSIVHVVRRIGKSTRKAVLATARALDRMQMEMAEWRASAKAKVQWWLEESRAAKARRARVVPSPAPVVPVDQTHVSNEDVKLHDGPTPPSDEVQDLGNPSTSPAGSAAASGDAVRATLLREKLLQAQEYLRSVERQEPAEGQVMDKWERIQWANRMSAAKDTVRVAREDLERQLGTGGADRG